MWNSENKIIEIGFYQLNKFGNIVCGDTFLSRKINGENRFVAVLSDGLGSGIKANVLSTITASMALNFRLRNEPILSSAKSIMNTLPKDDVRNITYSTFSILDIDFEGNTTVVEYGNPSFFVEQNSKIIIPEKKKIEIGSNTENKWVFISEFHLCENDRLILVSDGITQSGIGKAETPFGWQNEGLANYVTQAIQTNIEISASDLARNIVKQAEQNDEFRLQDDSSCAVIFRRLPRKMVLCTGPPFHEKKDRFMAEVIEKYPGKKIICGGTTAKIIAREIKQEIFCPTLNNFSSDLPPTSHMKGVDLITEGVLTLSKVYEKLESMKNHEIRETGPASDIIRHFLNSDIIDFVVGTRINEAHQDPSLPIELEIRRNIIKRICKQLELKFLKQTKIQFI